MTLDLCPHDTVPAWCQLCTRPPGEVYWCDRQDQSCGVCGDPVQWGELVVNLPAPAWCHPVAHAYC